MTQLIITIVGVLLIAVSLFLIIAVLMQSAKNSRMSGVVTGGGAETFFGKNKGKTIDRKLNTLTIVISIAFVAVVIAMYIIQPGEGKVDFGNPDDVFNNPQVTATAGTTTAAPAKTTAAPAKTTAAPAKTTAAEPSKTTAAEPVTTTAPTAAAES